MLFQFFDVRNAQTSLQILFNIFLTTESPLESLYAGEILVDFCLDSTAFDLVNT